MRKLKFLPILAALVMFLTANAGAETYKLGADAAVKVDYFHFFDSTLGATNAKDGIYVGLEGYKQLFYPNLYFGMEVGWAGTNGTSTGIDANNFIVTTATVDSSVNYVPIEFNFKYAVPISPCLKFALGSGVSINYFDYSGDVVGNSAASGSDNDWVVGGQFFGELNYKYRDFFFGVNVKYQLTQDLHLFGEDTGMSADNLRAGVQAGYTF